MATRKKSSKDVKGDTIIADDDTLIDGTVVDVDGSEIEITAADSADQSSDSAEARAEGSEPADASVPEGAVAEDAPAKEAGEKEAEESADGGKADLDRPAEDEPAEDSARPEPAAPEIVPAVAAEKIIVQKRGFIPMVLGGCVAAAIGFGVAQYMQPKPGLDAQQISDLQGKLTKQADLLAKQVEISDDLTGQVTALQGVKEVQSDNEAAISGLADRLSELEARLSDIEKRPVSEGDSAAALAAQDRELKAHDAALKELRAALDTLGTSAEAMEANAQAAAQDTLRRAAVTRLETALETGTGFAPVLADLKDLGVAIPDALANLSEEGVPTLAALQDSLPDAARKALEASRDASEESATGGIGSFLRTQLGARSLEPREGDDPDAVLSRVEAAAREGRLSDALTEIEALPQEGQEKLAGWVSRAKQRQEAVSATRELSEKLN